MSGKLTVEAIAEELNSLLRAFESDPKLNTSDPKFKTRHLYSAHARVAKKNMINICYVSYQGSRSMTFEEAYGYLNWLKEDDRWKNNFPSFVAYQDQHHREDPDNLCLIAEEKRRPGFQDQSKAPYEAVRLAYYKLLEVVAPRIPKPKGHSKYGDAPLVPKTGGGAIYNEGTVTWHVLGKEGRNAASELYAEIQQCIFDAYSLGKDHGQSALAQLARGDIAIGEFEKKPVVKVKRDWRGNIITEED